MKDPEVTKLNFFEHNPDFTDAGLARKARKCNTDTSVGPFTPTRLGIETDESRTPPTCRSMNKAGSARKPFGSEVKATVESFTHTQEDETIEIDTRDLQVSKLPQGGRHEQCIREGIADLQERGQNITLRIEDYRIYTYWIRAPELRNHMEQILISSQSIKRQYKIRQANEDGQHVEVASEPSKLVRCG